MAEEQTSNVIDITALAELPSRDLDVSIAVAGGDVWKFPCRELTYKRYKEIGRMCPDPSPPFMAGPKGKIYDYGDPDYQIKRAEAEDRRVYLRLAEFLLIEIPGKTLEEKADVLADRLPMAVVSGLAQQMNTTAERGETRVEARSETFQPG